MTDPFVAGPDLDALSEVVAGWLEGLEVAYERSGTMFSFALPGVKKLQVPMRLDLGQHAVAIHVFVCRRPDENEAGVHRWMLERNMRTFGVAFAIDRYGDIYLDGRLPLAAVSHEGLDQWLGAVLSAADDSFNVLLELGFASSIRSEWEWRLSRGESTANLEAFRGWLEAGTDPDSHQQSAD